MKRTNSEMSNMVRRLRVGNRTSNSKLDGLRWASSSVRLSRNGQVCQGHVAWGRDPRRPRSADQVWLGIVSQGPEHNPGQRYWIVYAGHNPVLASSEVSQRLYQRTLKGFIPDSTAKMNSFNLLPSDQVEEDLLEQLQPKPTESALANLLKGSLQTQAQG